MLTIHRRGFLGLTAGALAAAAGTPARAQSFTPRTARLPARGEYLIRSAHLVTMDAGLGDIALGNIHVRDGVIVAVGADVAAPGAQVIEARDMIVMPGFVDTHVHLWNGFMKGLFRSDDPKNGYFPLTQRAGPLLSPEDAYRSVRLGAAEALASGVTTLHNWAHNIRTPAHADAEMAALNDMGIRARHSYGWGTDFPGTKGIDLADVARLQREWQPRSQLLTLGVAVRTSVAMERGAVDMGVLRDEIVGARKLGVPLTMHARPGAVATLEKDSLLGPDFQLVHPLGFTADERAAIVRAQAKICTSPVSELNSQVAGNGYIQFAELAQAGAQIALSVDTLGSAGNGDFFAVMRGLLIAHRQRNDIKYPLPPRRVLELATIEGAKQLGLDSRTGSLVPGKRADLILVRTTDANIAPVFDDPVRAVVLSATVSNVDTVMVDGRILRQGGKFTSVDTGELAREATEAARGLQAKLS
jgi:cytosine/adenosine deaminase-related metal-dependent hydrolase